MKQVILDFTHGLSKWFHTLKRWQKKLLISTLVICGGIWILAISDIQEWWNWSEWMRHIRSEHL